MSRRNLNRLLAQLPTSRKALKRLTQVRTLKALTPLSRLPRRKNRSLLQLHLLTLRGQGQGHKLLRQRDLSLS